MTPERREHLDPSLAAARYRVERASGTDPGYADTGEADTGGADTTGTVKNGTGASGTEHAPKADKPRPTAEQLRAIAKTQLDIAIDRGDFDNLPLAGKPLPGLAGGTIDPDWWIKGLIEREGLSGVAPPALSLRTENTQLDDLLDTMATESSVRAHLAGFNDRIVEARRQLTGGPPVVTPLRDLDVEVARWQERRDARRARAQQVAAETPPPLGWRARRRAARAARRAQQRP